MDDPLAEIAALLGRPTVKLDTPEIQRFIAGRRVLVTGAGGSIGSEICRQIARFSPKRLVLLDRSEAGLFEIWRELKSRWIGTDLRPAVADVCDPARLNRIFEDEQPQVVLHVAAHKHVGLMEDNPGEAVKVNVFGTYAVAKCAADYGAKNFVLVSTDKAVNPTCIMGATKRAAEMIVQAAGRDAGCRFSAVRFGNVLGSSGSVVPIFAKQIAAGGPVTVTDARMKRFFMTIPEAAGLVMQAGSMGEGGEIFVLDMGEQISILKLAEAMIRRCGLEPQKDIAVRFTGIGAGEKLEEELAGTDEPTLPTPHKKISVWQLPAVSVDAVDTMLSDLRRVVDSTPVAIAEALASAVPEFEHDLTRQKLRPTLRIAA